MLTRKIAQYSPADLAAEVRAGLTKPGQKELPSKYLYDDVGWALFEVISVLPEYGLTRADERLLREHAAQMVERIPSPVLVAELAAAAARKPSGFSRRFPGASGRFTSPLRFHRPRWRSAKRNWGAWNA